MNMNRGGPELFVLTDARHPLEVEAVLLADVLECLLHHIIFHRALTGKAVIPKDMQKFSKSLLLTLCRVKITGTDL